MAILTRKDTDALFLTYPYRYAHGLANILFPGYYMDDETGMCYDADSEVGLDAFYEILTTGFKFPFKKTDYDSDIDIQKGLAKLYLDSDAFWEALKLLHYMAKKRLTDAYTCMPTQRDMVREAVQFLDTQNSSILFRKGNGRKKEIKDAAIVSYIRSCLESSPYYNEEDTTSYIKPKPENLITSSISERISYEAQALQQLFEKECRPEFEKRGKQYKCPLLLISRLMFFTGLTNNEDYLISSDTLKGILRSYPNPGVNTISLSME